jgi:hypothetical protein
MPEGPDLVPYNPAHRFEPEDECTGSDAEQLQLDSLTANLYDPRDAFARMQLDERDPEYSLLLHSGLNIEISHSKPEQKVTRKRRATLCQQGELLGPENKSYNGHDADIEWARQNNPLYKDVEGHLSQHRQRTLPQPSSAMDTSVRYPDEESHIAHLGRQA